VAPALTFGVVVAATAAVLAGLRARSASEPPVARAETETSPRASSSSPLPAVPPAQKLPEPAPASTAPPARAPDDALAAAIAQGSEGLLSLSRQFPEDAEVLKALVLSHASRAAELPRAVSAIKRLLAAAPDQRRDPDVRYILTKAALAPGPEASSALDVMKNDMGTAGPDLLYDMMLRRSALAPTAKAELAQLRRDNRLSPALSIAYDLRFAASCAGRLRLLERAEKLGDERSVIVLSNLAGKPPKCGRRGRPPCKARCEAEAKAFLGSIESISKRLKESPASAQ
jgi:hypothetical protein